MSDESIIVSSKSLPVRMKTLKVDIRTWDDLKSLKQENETFNDVIKELLDKRTKAIGNDNVQAIKYARKTGYFTAAFGKEVGFEYEYNDIKNHKDDFTIDLKIKKVFFSKKIYAPSEFFGLDNAHKHYSIFFLNMYFRAIALALSNEFRIHVLYEPFNIAYWRQLFYDYRLSEESFAQDIEQPLRLSEDEKPSKEWSTRMNESPSVKFIKETGIVFT